MKPSGIIRRIDDLGRIAIPKEIRRVSKIEENDPFEIFYDKGKILLEKYSPMGNISEVAGAVSGALIDQGVRHVIVNSFGEYVSGIPSMGRKFQERKDLDEIETAVHITCDGYTVGYLLYEKPDDWDKVALAVRVIEMYLKD